MNTRTTRNVLGRTLVDTSTATSIEEALALADLNYRVEKVELTSTILTEDGVTTVEFPNDRGIVARRGNHVEPFRTVGTKYQLIQNSEAFGPLQRLWDEGFITGIEEAGGLAAGQRAFVLARLASESLLADPHQRYLMVTTTHDGSGSVVAQGWAQRLHCANQIPMVLRSARRGGIVRIPHTSSATLRLRRMTHALQSAISMLDTYDREMEHLANVEVGAWGVERFLAELFPTPPNATDRQVNAVKLKQRTTRNLIEQSPTNENIRGTRAALFQGAIEWSDHYSDGRRAERILKGGDLKFKGRALELATVAP